jgi:hypothetical protein
LPTTTTGQERRQLVMDLLQKEKIYLFRLHLILEVLSG